MVSEIDPICALQAAMEGYEVDTMEDAAHGGHFRHGDGNKDIITLEHMRHMKDRAIVCNIGHFDSEIQVVSLKDFKRDNVKPQIMTSSSPTASASSVVRRPAGEPRQRDWPSVVRHVEPFLQPDPGPD